MQPNLCEAVSGYTLSTVNLAVAIPMAVVDLICSSLVFSAGLVGLVLSPVFDYVKYGGGMIMEFIGVEDWTHNTVMVTLLVGYYVAVLFLVSRGTGSCLQKSVSRVTYSIVSIIWIVNFLSFPVFESAVFPQVGLLSVAIQLGDLAITCLYKEHNDHASQAKENAMDVTAAGLLGLFRMEVFAALIISAFGYPSFSEEDDVTRYFCAVPFLAMNIIYFSSVRTVECPDTATPVPHANGQATVVKETPADQTILESDLKVPEECEENVVDKIAPEESAEEEIKEEPVDKIAPEESGEEESKEDPPKEDDEPNEGIASEVAAAVDTVVATACAVHEAIEEIKDVVEEKVEEITDKVNEKLSEMIDETEQIIEEDALFKRIQTGIFSIYSALQAQVSKVTTPVLNVISKIISTITGLPWTPILLFTFSNCSHLLWSYAWLHLTGNLLAYSLPLLTLATPLLLSKLSIIPPQAKHFISDLNTLSISYVQYLLITTEIQEE